MSETAVREHPILFSAPMVRAILDGHKTQTRRVIKPQPYEGCSKLIGPEWYEPTVVGKDGEERPGKPVFGCYDEWGEYGVKCPWQPGDRLWVRETCWLRPYRSIRMMRDGADTWPKVIYAADGESDWCREQGWTRRNSIHMPRWASRITLEVVRVWPERLQDISEDDARAEGICICNAGTQFECYWDYLENESRSPCHFTPNDSYCTLWDSINGKKYPASSNPWVWAIEFKRIVEDAFPATANSGEPGE